MVINDGGNVNDIIHGDDNGRDDDKGYHQYIVYKSIRINFL